MADTGLILVLHPFRTGPTSMAPARAEGVSIRTLAAAAGPSPARVRQITAGAAPGRLAGRTIPVRRDQPPARAAIFPSVPPER
jgi:hypothetical protein